MSAVLFEHGISPKSLKGLIITLIEEDMEFKESLQTYLVKPLVDEITRLKKLISNIEKHLGDDENFCIWRDENWENSSPTEKRLTDSRVPIKPIHRQFELVQKRLEECTVMQESVKQEPIAQTLTEKRAYFFLKQTPEAEITPSKDKIIKSKSFKYWLLNTLPEDLRPKSFQNLRKLKIDLFKTLKDLSDRVSLKKGSGINGEWKLILKSVT